MFLIEPRIRQRWSVVFEPAVDRTWYNRFLNREFAHCYLMAQADDDNWLIVSPTTAQLQFEVRPISVFPTPRSYAGEYATIIEYDVSLPTDTTTFCLGVMSCVDICKRVLGIRAFLVWTPWQLYRRLRDGKKSGWRIGWYVQNRRKRVEAGGKTAGEDDS